MHQNNRNWLEVKAKIIRRFGTVTACSHQIQCSVEGIRKAVSGKCPRVKKKLDAELANL